MTRSKFSTVISTLCIVAVVLMVIPFGLDIYRSVQKKDSLPSGGQAMSIIIYDDADLLTDVEEAKLYEDMKYVAAYSPVAFSTTGNAGRDDGENYAKRRFNEIFGDNQGILFSIDMDNHELYIWTDDYNTTLTKKKADTIADNIYRYATAKKYYKCAAKAMEQIYQVMSDKKVPEWMKHINNLLVSFVAGALIVFIVAKKKTKIKSPVEVYQLDANTRKNVKIFDINSVKTGQRVVYHNDSSSGGGGGGGRSGGGGGGGGGGHGGGGHGGGHGF